MRYPALLVGLALSIGLMAALPSRGAAQAVPASPCADSLYQALRTKPLNDLTEREYEYFKQREKTCTEFQRLAALANRPANAPAPPRREPISTEAFTRAAGTGNAVDVFVRNNSEVPIIVNSVRVFDCRNVRDTSCTMHYPKTRIRPNETRRVITIRFDSGLDGNSYRYEYHTSAAEEEGERQ